MKRIINGVLRRIRRWRKGSHQRVFSKVYTGNVWGNDAQSLFYSGTGSDEPYARPYSDVIAKFIADHNIKSIVDLGCGDFRIGKLITEENKVLYTGVDVVPDLIQYNTSKFANERIRFQHLNIVKDKLPEGELCLIRQVMQHLSNADIQKILKKCSQFKFFLVTEHQPIGDNITANLDKEPDESIRLAWNSGVFLDKPPFNKKVDELLTVFPEIEKESKIVTYRVYINS